jgi:hypothetical protein
LIKRSTDNGSYALGRDKGRDRRMDKGGTKRVTEEEIAGWIGEKMKGHID